MSVFPANSDLQTQYFLEYIWFYFCKETVSLQENSLRQKPYSFYCLGTTQKPFFQASFRSNFYSLVY
jgi:hypothetical protein